MKHPRSEIDWIDTQHALMRQRVTEWANINSGTGNCANMDRLASLIQNEFDVLGGATENIALEPAADIDASGRPTHLPLGKAIRILKRPNARLRVFLGIHMDTVYPADHPFQTVTVDGDKLRGPGVADAKGGMAVMLTALEAFERSRFATEIGWEVLLNPDEEIGSPGSAPLLVRAARNNHLGLIFEPSLPGGALAESIGSWPHSAR